MMSFVCKGRVEGKLILSPVFVSKSCPRLYFFGNFSSNLAISLVVYFAAFPSFYDVQQLKVFTHPTFHKIRLIKFQRSVSKVLLSQRESTVSALSHLSVFHLHHRHDVIVVLVIFMVVTTFFSPTFLSGVHRGEHRLHYHHRHPHHLVASCNVTFI